MKKLYENVLVLDSGARGATNTFVENRQGDVLIAWENEAYLSLEEYPDQYEIITPSISILAQPSVAVVDRNAEDHGTKELAHDYLEYLYSDEAQRLAGENYYRPSDEKILQEYSFYSVDSSSWLTGAARGKQKHTFQNGIIVSKKINNYGKKVKIGKVCAYNFCQWVLYQKYMEGVRVCVKQKKI